jgi:protein SCO1
MARLLPFLCLLTLAVSCSDRAASLPKLQQLGADLELTLPSGRKAHFSELKGKVLLVAQYYCQCPMGCSSVADGMRRIRTVVPPLVSAESAKNLHLLSIAIDPADTPKRLGEFTKEAYEVKDGESSWWFATGDQTQLRDFLTQQVGFTEVIEKTAAEQTSPQDKFQHDLRIALVDQKGVVRGFYNPASAANQEELKQILAVLADDVIALLEN